MVRLGMAKWKIDTCAFVFVIGLTVPGIALAPAVVPEPVIILTTVSFCDIYICIYIIARCRVHSAFPNRVRISAFFRRSSLRSR